MVTVQSALRTLQVEIVSRVFSPGKVDHGLQVIQLYAVLRTLWIVHLQLLQLFVKGVAHLGRPFLFLGFRFQITAFGRTLAVAQFLFDVLDLLLQEVFALLFIQVLARFRANLFFKFKQLHFLVQHFQRNHDALVHRVGLQHTHLVLVGERHVGAHVVDAQNVVLDVVQGKLCLVGDIIVLFDVLDGLLAKVLCGRLVFLIVRLGQYFRGNGRQSLQERFGLGDLFQLTASHRLNDGRDVLSMSRHFQHAHQSGVYTVSVQVFLMRFFHICIFLAEYGEYGIGGFLGFFNQFQAVFATNEDGAEHAREHHHVACC